MRASSIDAVVSLPRRFVHIEARGPMIDVHAHVFNLGYVPVQGILESRGLGRDVAKPVATLLLDALERDESLPTAVTEALTAVELPGAPQAAPLERMIDAFAGTVSTGFLQSHARDLDEALRVLDVEAPETIPESAEAAVAFEGLAESELRRKLRRVLERIARLLDQGEALIQWFLLMLSRETELVASLHRVWPASRLFVHHMMDMDNHYKHGRSLYPFVDLQLRRMRALVQADHGRLLTFVAYDPFRKDGVAIVEDALRNGCAGVKFYPPNGYRPLGNTKEDLAGTNQKPEVIDARNLELFELCNRLQVPIFAHCSPGGMESRPGKSGCLSDPRGWERVLNTDGLRTLRLCLGHAGGDDGWCAPPGAEEQNPCKRPFVAKVIELCVTFPNVYCEFGHTEQIFAPAPRANFAARLGEAVEKHRMRFGRKIMYGSDWHLLARTPAFGRFDDIFAEIFDADPRLQPYRSAFFMLNALDYLNLPAYLRRSDGVLSDEEKTYLRSLLLPSGFGPTVRTQRQPMTPNDATVPAADAGDDTLDLPEGMFRTGTNPKSTIVTIAKRLGKTRSIINMAATYEEVDDHALFEGDIVLGTLEEVRRAEAAADSRGIGIIGADYRWPGGIVPYVVADAALRDRVTDAIAHWMSSTPFQFKEKKAGDDAFISFQRLNGCYSRVGRQGGEQVISLGLGCGLGAAIHEIGHALGLWHEQSRSDRDQHITIVWENIDETHRHNFDKHVLDGTDLGEYDFGSIMHYPPKAFSVNGLDTIVTKNGVSIGQRQGLSAGDIAAIRLLYPELDWAAVRGAGNGGGT